MIHSHQYRLFQKILTISTIVIIGFSLLVFLTPEAKQSEPRIILMYAIIGIAIACTIFSVGFLSLPRKESDKNRIQDGFKDNTTSKKSSTSKSKHKPYSERPTPSQGRFAYILSLFAIN